MTAALPACDRTIAVSVPVATPVRHPRLILATTILASSLAFIDGSVVNVGLPAIGRDLGADGACLSWIVNGYLLPLSALLLLGGAAGDRFGRRRVLVAGVALFALASLWCALAPGSGWLIAGRVLQGVGAALLMPNSLAILGATFNGEARGRAIGVWAAVGAGAGAIGPLIGGWLIDVVGWRAMFLINVPIALLALYLGMRYLHDTPNPARPTLDLKGAALASIGLASLTWGLTVASSTAGIDPGAAIALVLGAVFLVLFLIVEHGCGDDAMLPLALFSSRSFVGLNLLTFLLYGALGALFVLVPFVLIEVNGYSATEAGAALLPLPVVIALASSTMGRIAGRIGPRLPLTLGPLIVAAGFFLATRIGAGGSYWSTTLPAMLVIAIGMAAAVAPLTTAVLASVATSHTGVASGFNSAVARSGGLIATAMLGMVLAAHGAALVSGFHVAAIVAGVASAAAGLCGLILLERQP
ncbi:EmrB/QacA subfamily drug resistance transporter [Actimicrobium sp. GrIS 1.19]|uniref:DHA2 family efflux MFS transporter permease subunit n=1 Tax=Actimicrobium sp. GrIS 1.19 TaxID=3071708 RepID=UPI002DF963F7|nr:EmrB/QacA subfamily drug resistance transporter [Actimicrobium sp. GrIS 1.19]